VNATEGPSVPKPLQSAVCDVEWSLTCWSEIAEIVCFSYNYLANDLKWVISENISNSLLCSTTLKNSTKLSLSLHVIIKSLRNLNFIDKVIILWCIHSLLLIFWKIIMKIISKNFKIFDLARSQAIQTL
jgi:hypothetical protein